MALGLEKTKYGTIIFNDINLVSGMEQTSFMFQQASKLFSCSASYHRRSFCCLFKAIEPTRAMLTSQLCKHVKTELQEALSKHDCFTSFDIIEEPPVKLTLQQWIILAKEAKATVFIAGFHHPTSNTASKNVKTSQITHEVVQIDVGQSVSVDFFGSVPRVTGSPSTDCGTQGCSPADDFTDNPEHTTSSSYVSSADASDVVTSTSSCNSPFYQLRKDATSFVSQTLDRRLVNLWQLAASYVSVLLSSPTVYSTSTFQFLWN